MASFAMGPVPGGKGSSLSCVLRAPTHLTLALISAICCSSTMWPLLGVVERALSRAWECNPSMFSQIVAFNPEKLLSTASPPWSAVVHNMGPAAKDVTSSFDLFALRVTPCYRVGRECVRQLLKSEHRDQVLLDRNACRRSPWPLLGQTASGTGRGQC